MKYIVNKIVILLNNNHGVDSKDITVIEERLNAAFPQDYITLLQCSNGGSGRLKTYLHSMKSTKFKNIFPKSF